MTWQMNTRGLVELIVLNVGLEAKVISPKLFTIMVLMVRATLCRPHISTEAGTAVDPLTRCLPLPPLPSSLHYTGHHDHRGTCTPLLLRSALLCP